jgi:hypothetical protein
MMSDAAPPQPFRDRSGALVAFGILQIVIGLICAMFVLALAAAMEIASRRGIGAPPNVGPAFVIYGAAAFYFITVGTGSIRTRRWARAMSVAFSAAWLAIGVAVVLSSFVFMQRMLVFVRPSETFEVVAWSSVILIIAFIALPLVLFLFYRGDDVRRTCDSYDPTVRWTDRVPWPVLAVATLMGFMSFITLTNVGDPVVPFFGMVLTGASAALTMLTLAGLFGFLTVQWVVLKKSAWWTTLLLHVIGGIVAVITLARGDIGAVYAQMNMPREQIQAMQLDTLNRNPALWLVVIVVWAAYLGVLLYTRRYFDTPVPRTRATDVARAAAA